MKDLFIINEDGVVSEETEAAVEVPAINLLLDNHRAMTRRMPKAAVSEVYFEINEWACNGFNESYVPEFQMASGCEMAQDIMFTAIQKQVNKNRGTYIKKKLRKNKGGAPKGNQNAKKFEAVSISNNEIGKLKEHYSQSIVMECLKREPKDIKALETLVRKQYGEEEMELPPHLINRTVF